MSLAAVQYIFNRRIAETDEKLDLLLAENDLCKLKMVAAQFNYCTANLFVQSIFSVVSLCSAKFVQQTKVLLAHTLRNVTDLIA